jgi:hypothetical protein
LSRSTCYNISLQIVLRVEVFALAAGLTYGLALAEQTFDEKSRRVQHHPRMMPIQDEDDTQPHPAEAGTVPSDLFAEEIKYFQSKTFRPQNTDPDLSLTLNLEEHVSDETNDVPVIIIIDLSDLVKPRIIALVIVLVRLCELIVGKLQFNLDLISSERDSEMLPTKSVVLFSFFVLQHAWEELGCTGIVARRLQGPRKLSTPRTTAATLIMTIIRGIVFVFVSAQQNRCWPERCRAHRAKAWLLKIAIAPSIMEYLPRPD